MLRVASLDLGTNTFLCLIAEGTPQGINKVYFDQAKTVRLGQGLSVSGILHPEALLRAEDCLRAFKKEIDKFNPQKTLALATSAARDAKNGFELIEICNRLQIPVEIIDGKMEAELTFAGAVAGVARGQDAMVIDIGGGSTEYIVGSDQGIRLAKSLNIGCVRLTEKFVGQQPLTPLRHEEIKIFIMESLSQNLNEFRDETAKTAVAVAGTPTTIVAAEIGGYDPHKIEGFILTESILKKWNKIFLESSIEEKINNFGIDPKRADIIYVGSEILLQSMSYLGLSQIIVSVRGVRYGIAEQLLKEGEH